MLCNLMWMMQVQGEVYERQMKQFKSVGQARRFLAAHDQINNLFHFRCDHLTAAECRAARTDIPSLGGNQQLCCSVITANVPCPSREAW
jgi:hypothetical protein